MHRPTFVPVPPFDLVVFGATGDLSTFNNLWADQIGGRTVDETPLDSSMRTYVDTWLGVSMRRIKHFTGYVAGSGKTCEPGDEQCE